MKYVILTMLFVLALAHAAFAQQPTIKGELTATDPLFPGAGRVDAFEIRVQSGDSIRVRLRSASFDPYLLIIDRESGSGWGYYEYDAADVTRTRTVPGYAEKDGWWIILATSQAAGVAGTELGAYEVDVVRNRSIAPPTDARPVPAARVVAILEARRLYEAGTDTTRSVAERVRSLEQAKAAYDAIGFQQHGRRALSMIGFTLDKLNTPEAKKRMLEIGHQLLRDDGDDVGAYSLIVSAHPNIDSVFYYKRKEQEASAAFMARLRLPELLPADTVRGGLSIDDPKFPKRGFTDIYEFDGKKGERVKLEHQLRSGSSYSLLVSPAGDTAGHPTYDGITVEHTLEMDGKWLALLAGFTAKDTARYRITFGYRNQPGRIPKLTPLSKQRANAWIEARTLMSDGDFARSQGKNDLASVLYEKAARLLVTAKREGEAAMSLLTSAALSMATNEARATSLMKEGRALSQSTGLSVGLAMAEVVTGHIHHLHSRPDSGFAHLTRAQAMFKELGMSKEEQQIGDQIGALRSAAMRADASGVIRGSLAADDVIIPGTDRPIDAWTFEANAGDTIAVSATVAGHATRLRLRSPLGVDTATDVSAGTTAQVSAVANETGWWFITVGSPQRAVSTYELKVVRTGRTRVAPIISAVAPGQLRAYLQASILQDSARQAGATLQSAEMFKRAGDLYLTAHRHRQAFLSYMISRQRYQDLKQTSKAGEALSYAGFAISNDTSFAEGDVYYNLFSGQDQIADGNYAWALNSLYRAFGRWQQIGAGNSIWGEVSLAMGDANAALGREKALRDYQSARTSFLNHEKPREAALATQRLGATQLALGRANEAVKTLNDALRQQRALKNAEGEAAALRSLGEAHAAISQPDSSMAYYFRALALQRATATRGDVASTLKGIGDAHQQLGRADSALMYHRQALATFRDLDNKFAEGRVLHSIGKTHARNPDGYARAVSYYDSAAAVFSEVRERAGYESERISIADQFATLSHDWMRGWIGRSREVGEKQSLLAALAAVERGRAQALIDMMRNDQRRTSKPNSDLVAEGQSLLTSIASTKAATISYLHSADTLFAFVTSGPGEVFLHRTAVADTTLTRLVAEMRASLNVDSASVRTAGDLERNEGPGIRARSGSRGYAGVLREIRDLVLHPALLASIPTGADVIIVPHGSLALVPFAALSTGEELFSTRNRLRYAPSLNAIIEAEKRPSRLGNNRAAAMRQALVVGNPEMPSPLNTDFEARKLDQLPGAEKEGRAVAQRLGAQFITGAAATEADVVHKMKTAPLIHLATHGFAYGNEARARDSFIALAPGKNEDGLLTVGEVLSERELTMSADLVVLSACQTGLGERKVAEGTVGLQWAFMAKGARTVLVSLWSVDDAVTNQLMQSFYTHWTAGASKSAALQKAQEEVRKTHPNPRYWAAFQLVGAN